uniref:Si:dkey-86e18.1 n=1 Tax=Hippocampus comes TaxID=109280 RepID=A0A3Q3DKL5_HIPCM
MTHNHNMIVNKALYLNLQLSAAIFNTEGRLKDVQERRPKLCTLNSASSVKKWIPSIKKDMEYYLQQSQLAHYPERKIEEFQLKMEALEREYKRFVTKLRVLDPTCKHKPWTLRAYCKRRADVPDKTLFCLTILRLFFAPCAVKKSKVSTAAFSHSEPSLPASMPTVEVVSKNQDQPLNFDRTRLAIVAAAFRAASDHQGVSQTQNLARTLQRSLLNLGNMAAEVSSVVGQKEAAEESAQRTAAKSSRGHVLGLDCYSSSGEESDS